MNTSQPRTVSERPWRAEIRNLPGTGFRDSRWSPIGTFASSENAQAFLERERPYHGNRYEYRLLNRNTAQVISL